MAHLKVQVKVGDLVVLRGHSQIMTVVGLSEDGIQAAWFTKNGSLDTAWLKPEALSLINSEKHVLGRPLT